LTDDKGGSDKQEGEESGGKDQKNKYAKMSMDQIIAENVAVSKERDALKSKVGELAEQLDEANKVLEGQEKQRLLGEILPRSTYKADELAGKTVEELKEIRATLDMAMPPKVNSVRVGVAGADLSDRERGLTVGDLSVVTAQKRKQARA
jgi:DNA topoisomerase VI subunit B